MLERLRYEKKKDDEIVTTGGIYGRILLVDDILTTGTTASVIAEKIKSKLLLKAPTVHLLN